MTPGRYLLATLAALLLPLQTPTTLGEGTVDSCSDATFETALEQALLGGGLVTLQCTDTRKITSTKIISRNTTITNATTTGTLTSSGSNRFFHILPGVTLTLHNLTLSNGSAPATHGTDASASAAAQPGTDAIGGAILNEGGHLVALNVTFENNEAAGGQGGNGLDIERFAGSPSAGANGGQGLGGAIASLGGSLTLTNCSFTGNLAQGGQGGNGGAATSSFIGDGASGGHAGLAHGGAIFLTQNASLLASGCNFSLNESTGTQGGSGGNASGLGFFAGQNGNSTPAHGGALFLEDSSANLVNGCTFSENNTTGADGLPGKTNTDSTSEAAGQPGQNATGGAITIENSSIALSLASFSFNYAKGGNGGDGGSTAGSGNGGDGGQGGNGMGAAIHASSNSSLHITDSRFENNNAQGGYGGFSSVGANFLATFGTDGSAGQGLGGAIRSHATQTTINRSTFDNNLALGAEGLEGLTGTAFEPGSRGNSGGQAAGGAILAPEGSLSITNSTFHANTANGGPGGKGGNGGSGLAFATDGGDGGRGGSALGGAISIGPAVTSQIVHSTFADNQILGGIGGIGGDPGDDGLADPGSPGSTGSQLGTSIHSDSTNLTLYATLLSHSTLTSNVHGSTIDAGFNLSSDSTPLFHPGSSSRNSQVILLAPLADNGGPTRTIALDPASPAVNLTTPLPNLTFDQRGLGRDLSPDSGAFELNAPLPPLKALPHPSLSNYLTVSWPASALTFSLQSNPSLSPSSTNWSSISGASLSNNTWTVTIPNDSTRYFRLSY
jgi:hypothetical protein